MYGHLHNNCYTTNMCTSTAKLTVVEEAMEKALGCITGKRSNKYDNGMLAVAEGKSIKTSNDIRRTLLQ